MNVISLFRFNTRKQNVQQLQQSYPYHNHHILKLLLNRGYTHRNDDQNRALDYDNPADTPQSKQQNMTNKSDFFFGDNQYGKSENTNEGKNTTNHYEMSEQITATNLDKDIPTNRDRDMNTNVYNANQTIYSSFGTNAKVNNTKNLSEGQETLNKAGNYQNEMEKGTSAIGQPDGFKPNLNADNNFGMEAKWHPHIDFNDRDSRKYVLGSLENDIERKKQAHGKQFVGGKEQMEKQFEETNQGQDEITYKDYNRLAMGKEPGNSGKGMDFSDETQGTGFIQSKHITNDKNSAVRHGHKNPEHKISNKHSQKL